MESSDNDVCPTGATLSEPYSQSERTAATVDVRTKENRSAFQNTN